MEAHEVVTPRRIEPVNNDFGVVRGIQLHHLVHDDRAAIRSRAVLGRPKEPPAGSKESPGRPRPADIEAIPRGMWSCKI